MFLLRLLSRLPLWWLYRLSDLLFPLVYYVVRYRRDDTKKSKPSSIVKLKANGEVTVIRP